MNIKRSVKKRFVSFVFFILIMVIVLVTLFPILVIVLTGFKRDIDVWNKNPFYFKLVSTNYVLIFTNLDFRKALTNSLVVATSCVVLCVFLGSLAAYGFTRFNFKVKNSIIMIFLMLRMIPQITLGVPLYIMFRALGLRDTLFGLILAHISFNLPYVIALFLPFFSAIPKEYEEAARVDGCTELAVFARIFLPLASPGIVVGAVLAFLMSWNEFVYALILSGARTRVASVAIQAFLGQYAPLWGQLCAAGTIMLIPTFAITLGLQKYIIKGLSAGGIKG